MVEKVCVSGKWMYLFNDAFYNIEGEPQEGGHIDKRMPCDDETAQKVLEAIELHADAKSVMEQQELLKEGEATGEEATGEEAIATEEATGSESPASEDIATKEATETYDSEDQVEPNEVKSEEATPTVAENVAESNSEGNTQNMDNTTSDNSA